MDILSLIVGFALGCLSIRWNDKRKAKEKKKTQTVNESFDE